MKKKILAILVATGILSSTMAGTAFAYTEKVDWITYYTGPGAAAPTAIVELTYKNKLTNSTQATSVTGANASVTVSGINIKLYDIPSGRYTTYTFSASSMGMKQFRPFAISGTPEKGKYQCKSVGSSTYYSQGYVKY